MTDGKALDIKIAHLSMIQGVIARMAGDGQTMKTLAITISAAIIAVAPVGGWTAVVLACTGLIALVFFWWQTAYQLHVERAYRCLYNKVREDKSVPAFTMEWRDHRDQVDNPGKLAFTPSVLLPFAGMFVVLTVLTVISVSGVVATRSSGGNVNGTIVQQQP